MRRSDLKILLCVIMGSVFVATAADARLLADELPKLTTLSDSTLSYTVPVKAYAVLRRGGIEVVVVNNEAVDDEILPGHRAGYSGVASLKTAERPENLFVPGIAGPCRIGASPPDLAGCTTRGEPGSERDRCCSSHA